MGDRKLVSKSFFDARHAYLDARGHRQAVDTICFETIVPLYIDFRTRVQDTAKHPISFVHFRAKTVIPPISISGTNRFSEESALCITQTVAIPNFPLCQVSCVLFFLLPMVFIAVLYVRMGLRIQSSSLEHNVEGSVHGETRQAQSRRVIIRMLSKCPMLTK